jgi:hypothetical protein
MKKKEVKTTITLDGQTHEIMISKERAIQIKRLQKLIKEKNTQANPLHSK